MLIFSVTHLPYFIDNGFLKTFFEKTKNMTPEERAEFLEEDDVSHLV